ncbi:MAG: hypothetical protein M1288_04555 [Actinobacteria bacterium]|jgi:flagellar basal-body rod modification protein FlgD|nr:hypothetical protein [Actinomycetota bacterium]
MTSAINQITNPQTAQTSLTTNSLSGNSQGMGGLTSPTTFLTMLVDEMKYQNPLQPTSSATMMAQLAQLSQVEQMTAISTALQNGEASGLIGKTVTGVDNAGNSVSGTVTGTADSSNGPLLYIGGKSVNLSTITSVGTV